MNTDIKVDQLVENLGTVQFITSSISIKFKIIIILFDSVGKLDYVRSLKDSKHVLDVEIKEVFMTLSYSHIGCVALRSSLMIGMRSSFPLVEML